MVIGVTGSNGKSTTATMLAAILSADGQKTWLGGNIGVSLLSELPAIETADRVVLELSSFQLAHLSDRARFPTAAVVTNCTPNHLDWHGLLPAYTAAKRRLIDGLPPDGFAVLNPADPESWSWRGDLRAKLVTPAPTEQIPQLAVPGEHNRLNAALAAAAAVELGASATAITTGLGQFSGLEHRCQALEEAGGRRIIDDSKSTTPEATLSALTSCGGRVWLLLGGQDKGADFGPLQSQVVRQAAGAACFGFVGRRLQAGLAQLSTSFPCCAVTDLPAAFSWCWENSQPGDTILLSPACASLDQFRDFVHRAEVFRALVAAKRQGLDG
jgi:UDP-N-acetylmuramoylalanine--D-glutamate ligase